MEECNLNSKCHVCSLPAPMEMHSGGVFERQEERKTERISGRTKHLPLKRDNESLHTAQHRSSLGTTSRTSLSPQARALTRTQSNISGETWKWPPTDSPHPSWQSLWESAEDDGRISPNPGCKACYITQKGLEPVIGAKVASSNPK